MTPSLHRARVSSYSRAPSDIEKTYYAKLIGALIERRVARRMTQEQLDQLLGVTDGQVAKWEAFMRLPGAFMMVCWASALGVELAAIPKPEEPRP